MRHTPEQQQRWRLEREVRRALKAAGIAVGSLTMVAPPALAKPRLILPEKPTIYRPAAPAIVRASNLRYKFDKAILPGLGAGLFGGAAATPTFTFAHTGSTNLPTTNASSKSFTIDLGSGGTNTVSILTFHMTSDSAQVTSVTGWNSLVGTSSSSGPPINVQTVSTSYYKFNAGTGSNSFTANMTVANTSGTAVHAWRLYEVTSNTDAKGTGSNSTAGLALNTLDIAANGCGIWIAIDGTSTSHTGSFSNGTKDYDSGGVFGAHLGSGVAITDQPMTVTPSATAKLHILAGAFS